MVTGLNPFIAYLAGALTILSPCVLPLVPIVLGSAAHRHKRGPVALTAGLVISFTLTGFAIASLGASSEIDSEVVRLSGAIMLLLVGILLLVSKAQELITRMASPLVAWAGDRQAALERFGLGGQAAIGALLGLVWSPCVGPTLGAAILLAAQGKNLAQVAVVMTTFGLGTATVLLAIALAARRVFSRWRLRAVTAARSARKVLGCILVIVSLFILTGVDRVIEGVIVTILPQWLVDLTTAI